MKHSARVSWTEAHDTCVDQGGHLAVVTDKEDQKQLQQVFESSDLSVSWLAGYEDGSDWLWITGEPRFINNHEETIDTCLTYV